MTFIDSKYVTFKKEPFYEIAETWIDCNSIVLDIGCGDAKFSKFCKRKDFYLYDGNEVTVKSLKNEYPNVTLGNLPKLPYKNNFFDIIHCSHVIEHLTPEEFYQTLKEMDRCLKNEGILIISAPLLWEGFYNDISHVKPYNPKVFYNYLIQNFSQTRSRPKISENYIQKDLIFRYRKIAITEDIIEPDFNIFLKYLYKKMISGIEKFEKTGYTIVLQKGSSKF